jgi:hypothetical protein
MRLSEWSCCCATLSALTFPRNSGMNHQWMVGETFTCTTCTRVWERNNVRIYASDLDQRWACIDEPDDEASHATE